MGDLFGQSSVSYAQSPQQSQVWQYIQPLLAKMSQAGTSGYGGNMWQIPMPPSAPQAILPNTGWFNNLAPEVKTSLSEPMNYALDVLGERMGQAGSSGSARGGYSGAYGVAAGKLASEFAENMGNQAWQMTYPQLQNQQTQDWNMAQSLWQNRLQQNAYPYSALTGMTGGTYANPVVSQSPNYLGTLANAGMSTYALGKAFNWF